ncbi:MAG: hypothetical protein ACOYN4_14030 [Bacteroidales bacterium]
MKTLQKTGISFLIFALIASLMVTSCKKDDDNGNESISGYFSIDGTKYELSKCYISKRINNDAGHENEDNYDLVFAGESITLTNISSMPTGNGDMFAVILTTDISEDGIESGDYVSGSDESLPSLHMDALFITGWNSSTQTYDKEGEVTGGNIPINVTKTNSTYKFDWVGTTDDGKSFIFSYSGTITLLAPHEI